MSLSFGTVTPTGTSAGQVARTECHWASVRRRCGSGVMLTCGPSSPPRVRHGSRRVSMKRMVMGSGVGEGGAAAHGVRRGLEGLDADAADRVDEALGRGALLAVGGDERLDDVGHLVGRERRADHLAGSGGAAERRAVGAAERHLVPLGAVLVDAEDADVAAVVMAARV